MIEKGELETTIDKIEVAKAENMSLGFYKSAISSFTLPFFRFDGIGFRTFIRIVRSVARTSLFASADDRRLERNF